MNSFLYYVPGYTSQTITPAEVIKAGLSYAFPAGTPKFSVPLLGNSPDGQPGAIWTDCEHYRYQPETQVWEKHESAGYWVGMHKERRPGPEDLKRPKMLDGEEVELGDGNLWVVPRARRWSMEDDPGEWIRDRCELPRVVRYSTAGGVRGLAERVIEDYAFLWEIAEADMRYRFDCQQPEDGERYWTLGSLHVHCLDILGVNYVLGPCEANLLELIRTNSYQTILDALGDWVTHRDFVEKKSEILHAALVSSSGQGATRESTDQLLPT